MNLNTGVIKVYVGDTAHNRPNNGVTQTKL